MKVCRSWAISKCPIFKFLVHKLPKRWVEMRILDVLWVNNRWFIKEYQWTVILLYYMSISAGFDTFVNVFYYYKTTQPWQIQKWYYLPWTIFLYWLNNYYIIYLLCNFSGYWIRTQNMNVFFHRQFKYKTKLVLSNTSGVSSNLNLIFI